MVFGLLFFFKKKKVSLCSPHKMFLCCCAGPRTDSDFAREHARRGQQSRRLKHSLPLQGKLYMQNYMHKVDVLKPPFPSLFTVCSLIRCLMPPVPWQQLKCPIRARFSRSCWFVTTASSWTTAPTERSSSGKVRSCYSNSKRQTRHLLKFDIWWNEIVMNAVRNNDWQFHEDVSLRTCLHVIGVRVS